MKGDAKCRKEGCLGQLGVSRGLGNRPFEKRIGVAIGVPLTCNYFPVEHRLWYGRKLPILTYPHVFGATLL